MNLVKFDDCSDDIVCIGPLSKGGYRGERTAGDLDDRVVAT
ncbi:hypothetical protein FF011L_41890 [Roseimaritima multifibrata]|uniref:Uncharacterized protein n=1 Tax=Roseimaritima multifibrata TaxID=1930274 RepID=A0A517MKH9_9BACT|nr:hypothetical protein FF011L_41890 [Roseimaritima multifibrata]